MERGMYGDNLINAMYCLGLGLGRILDGNGHSWG